MPPIVVDLVIGVLILGMTYALMSEGLWGSALMFFNVLFAGIIAFNFYEPLAAMLATNLKFLASYADCLCLLGIFIVSVVLLRLTTETLAPAMVRFPTPLYHLGRIIFGLGGSAVTLAIILLAFEAAPVHKKVFGAVDYKYKPPFGMGLDHEWLGFFQWTTGMIFPNNRAGSNDPYKLYGNAKVFDPRGEWLLHHQEARPYGTESVLGGDGGEEGGEGGAAGGGGEGGAPGGGAPAGGPPGAGAGRDNGPNVVLPTSGVPVVIPGN